MRWDEFERLSLRDVIDMLDTATAFQRARDAQQAQAQQARKDG